MEARVPMPESIQVCAEFHSGSLVDVYFENRDTQTRGYELDLTHEVAYDIGLYGGAVWYRAVWIWESTQECDEAFRQEPEDIDERIAYLAHRIADFIADETEGAHVEIGKSKASLDITPDLAHLGFGWHSRITIPTKDEAARAYARAMRLKGILVNGHGSRS